MITIFNPVGRYSCKSLGGNHMAKTMDRKFKKRQYSKMFSETVPRMPTKAIIRLFLYIKFIKLTNDNACKVVSISYK